MLGAVAYSKTFQWTQPRNGCMHILSSLSPPLFLCLPLSVCLSLSVSLSLCVSLCVSLCLSLILIVSVTPTSCLYTRPFPCLPSSVHSGSSISPEGSPRILTSDASSRPLHPSPSLPALPGGLVLSFSEKRSIWFVFSFA